MRPLQPGAPSLEVPAGWSVRIPGPEDVDALAELITRHRRAVLGSGRANRELLASEVSGTGSWTRRQVMLLDADDVVRAYAVVHDRAAGRTNVSLTVCPDLDDTTADAITAVLVSWITESAIQFEVGRGLTHTQLDADVLDGDERTIKWLRADGYSRTRTWLHMSRPVTAADADLPSREGVTVRPVATHPDGSPVAEDLQAVHTVLEESFEDHFNAFRESFAEFAQRLREDPGHRWDHWWLASVEIDGSPMYAGSLVSSVSPPDDSGIEGSYIDYIGVNRLARGRGVAKSLLHTVIADAARRGRNRVGLEVDADSPTGADELYTSMGWVTEYRSESWHRDLAI